MNELTALLEATALAQFLKGSRWVYPLVNAGHILGIALLVGAIVPLDLTLSGLVRRMDPASATRFLRPFAIAGLSLAVACGLLLFITQAQDYSRNPLFQTKMGLLALALANATWHLRSARRDTTMIRLSALLSLLFWASILLLGRFVGYYIG